MAGMKKVMIGNFMHCHNIFRHVNSKCTYCISKHNKYENFALQFQNNFEKIYKRIYKKYFS